MRPAIRLAVAGATLAGGALLVVATPIIVTQELGPFSEPNPTTTTAPTEVLGSQVTAPPQWPIVIYVVPAPAATASTVPLAPPPTPSPSTTLPTTPTTLPPTPPVTPPEPPTLEPPSEPDLCALLPICELPQLWPPNTRSRHARTDLISGRSDITAGSSGRGAGADHRGRAEP